MIPIHMEKFKMNVLSVIWEKFVPGDNFPLISIP